VSAHDVRHLKLCPHCRDIGDDRLMVKRDGKDWHGRCFSAAFGLDALLGLSDEQKRRLTLGDIGPDAMAKLLAGTVPETGGWVR